ncbi:MAG: hypothetical protein FWE31_01745 [Firmicutes bacterium]|nr:hypothetical protein [Bacillota bacterium]
MVQDIKKRFLAIMWHWPICEQKLEDKKKQVLHEYLDGKLLGFKIDQIKKHPGDGPFNLDFTRQDTYNEIGGVTSRLLLDNQIVGEVYTSNLEIATIKVAMEDTACCNCQKHCKEHGKWPRPDKICDLDELESADIFANKYFDVYRER